MLKRIPLRRSQQPLRRSPLKRVSDAKRENRATEVEEQQRDEKVYREIWEERPHICYETLLPLWGEMSKIYAHHVLPKHLYPEYRHEKWNIVLVSRQVHEQLEFSPKEGTRIKALYEELLQKHYELKNQKEG